MAYEFLDAWGDKIQREAAKALIQAAHKIQGDAKALCPVNKQSGGGHLRESITVRVGDEDGGVVADVGTNLDYGPYVEFGTGPVGAASPKALPPGMNVSYTNKPWTYRDPKTGRFISTKGQPARPFLYPAFKQNERYVKERVAKAVKAAIRNGGD